MDGVGGVDWVKMTSRENHSEVIISFLISDEFEEILTKQIENHTKTLHEKIAGLKQEVTILRDPVNTFIW